MVSQLTHGVMIVVDFAGSDESESRLFRKKRQKLEKKTKLKSIKKGVYFIPFENLRASEEEKELFAQILHLMRKYHVKGRYFHVAEFIPQKIILFDDLWRIFRSE